ncbi:hypothetical protein REPUB_Repub06bG0197300 [Reevesia pubescens]
MTPNDPKQTGGFFASIANSLSNIGTAMTKSVNGILGYEGLEVVNPEGGTEDAEEEARRGRWKQEDRDSYWKTMQKYIGSDVTSMVTLPVLIFEPMSMLQKMAELMEYSYLLDLADDCEDPYMRMVYTTSWAISVYYGFQRTWKPFNPILGETYEMVNHGGITFISEQVSHHPPISAGHAENEHFIYDISSKVKTKFLGNSIDIYPIGRTRVTLKRDGVVFDLVPPPTKVNNLIFGRTWVDNPGEMIMTNLTTGDKTVLYFQPCGWFGAGRYEIDGYVYNAAEEPKILMTGKWNESISYQPCDSEGEPLPGTELKEAWRLADAPKNDKFQYTYFAHKINSFDTAPKKLLASDSRLRPDRYALEQGDLSKAGYEKSSLEERQRAEKRNREGKGHKFTPKWFDFTNEVAATLWGDLELYQYNDMVSQTRLDYGFSGYQVPVFPRASRSARVRVPIRNRSGNDQKCAFEILASIAGELLQESKTFVPPNCKDDLQNAPKSTVLKEQEDERQSSKCNHSDQETYDEKTFIHGYHQIYTLNKFSHAQDQFNLKDFSSLKSFDQSENICLADQLANINGRNANLSAEVVISSLLSGDFSEGQVENAGAELSSIQSVETATLPLTGSLDVLEMDHKPPAFFCSESKLKASLFKDWISLGPSRHSDNIETVSRDDDENSIGCTQAATTLKAFRLPSYVADRRIKNLSSSRHWRVSPNLNGGASFRNGICQFCGFVNTGLCSCNGKRRTISHNGRTSYTRQRSERISRFKRRKFFNQCPFSAPDRGFQFEDEFNSGDNCSAAVRVASSLASPRPHPGSRDCNVKLCIKSFKVPELFVEIPTTATVGSLKRTVMEAVATVLGDGLHVGILLQGKKVRDDSKTLLQTGISQDHKHHNLGFMLEPRHTQIIPPPCPAEQGITRNATSFTLQPVTSGVSLVPPVTDCNSGAESDLHLVSSLSNISANSTIRNSQSVVSIPAISVEALAVLPFHQRPAHRDFVQRRIRRPFSVSEVEALVQAVEKLGTGRWRDVKLRAFDNAKHRTYVDLKDKWKTLVHTARISPQQRRGEPVPQELLDRVLAAHAYWSQHRAKQQLKSGI